MSNKRGKKNNYHRPNVWGMIRDIGVASLNKGQFPLAVFATIVILIVLRMPQETIAKFAFEILAQFKSLHIVGWVLSGLLASGWLIHSKKLRRVFSREFERISGEKKTLQEKLNAKVLPSSNKSKTK
jgi:hypothetical protein